MEYTLDPLATTLHLMATVVTCELDEVIWLDIAGMLVALPHQSEQPTRANRTPQLDNRFFHTLSIVVTKGPAGLSIRQGQSLPQYAGASLAPV